MLVIACPHHIFPSLSGGIILFFLLEKCERAATEKSPSLCCYGAGLGDPDSQFVNLVFRGLIPLWNSIFCFFSQVLKAYVFSDMVLEAGILKDLGPLPFVIAALCLPF